MSSSFVLPSIVEARYRRGISALFQRELSFNLDDDSKIDEWLKKLEKVSYDPSFIRESEILATSMVKGVDAQNALNWMAIARKSYGGSRYSKYFREKPKGVVKESYQDQIEFSTDYISSLPAKIARNLRLQAETARGLGATEQGVLNILRSRFIPLLKNRISLLGRTDPHRTNSALTRARSEELSFPCFLWTTSEDDVVRISHQKMNGVLIFWRDLPSPEKLIGMPSTLGNYAAGDCPGCRCSAIPVFSIDDLFTTEYSRISVYYAGKIRKMTRGQLLKLL